MTTITTTATAAIMIITKTTTATTAIMIITITTIANNTNENEKGNSNDKHTCYIGTNKLYLHPRLYMFVTYMHVALLHIHHISSHIIT